MDILRAAILQGGDMDLFTVDFETYYDRMYSLSRLQTEDYISDPQFEIIMVGVKKNDEPTRIFTAPTFAAYERILKKLGVHEGAVLCHNTMFDGLILQDRLNISPRMYFDTLAMAQCLLKPKHRSISLDSCMKIVKLGIEKGSAVHDMIGRRQGSLSTAEIRSYGEYCANDCDAEYALFKHLITQLPKEELSIIDMTLRMYIEPKFDLDVATLEGVLEDTRNEAIEQMAALPAGIDEKQLSSNPQFAELLKSYGVEPPIKISPTTDKPTWAFAKTDPGWKDLEDEYADDSIVSAILAARLGVKSTIAESRAKRFLLIAQRYGRLRVPLRYYAAHTGRYGGMENINCQNLPRIKYDPVTRLPTSPNQLRFALKAPPGHAVLTVDLKQIEARLNAWFAQCDPLLKVFRDKGDPYCEFASTAFRRVITQADTLERFIGKTCVLGLGFGMSDKKLRATLRKDNVKVSEFEARTYVDVYRSKYREIPSMWKTCQEVIELIAHGGKRYLGPCTVEHNKIVMPNGLPLTYHRTRHIETAKYKGWVYDFAGLTRTLWGGKIVENIIQSLARIVVMQAMLAIRKQLGLHPALQAHDELVYIVPEQHAQYYERAILEIITVPPDFAPDLPVDAETGIGPTYGDAK